MKACTVCAKPLSRKAKTGFCRKHFNERMNADPAIKAKRSASLAKFLRDNPDRAHYMAKKSAASRMAKPGARERAQEAMRAAQPLSYTPEAMARRDHKARAAKCSALRLSWCPEPYRALYMRLRRGRGFPMAEAKQIVLDQVKADEAALSPFERQERALRNGAGLQDNLRLDRYSDSATELRQKLA